MSPKADYDNLSQFSGDSGLDEPMMIPNEELIEQIVTVVEDIFSDENLVVDEFMNKQIRKMSDGSIKIKFLISFNKVRRICGDWRVVSYAIEVGSKMLEVVENGAKVRRRIPLSANDGYCKYSRTVIALGLPMSKNTSQMIIDDFSIFGTISLVSIIDPVSVKKNLKKKPRFTKLLLHIEEEHYQLANIPNTLIAAIEFNNKPDALRLLQHSEKMRRIDSVYENVSFRQLNKLIENQEEVCKIRYENSQHVLKKPAGNEKIVITLTSSGLNVSSVAGTHKNLKSSAARDTLVKSPSTCSLSSNDSSPSTSPISSPQFPRFASKITTLRILRQPLIPDGSRGFNR